MGQKGVPKHRQRRIHKISAKNASKCANVTTHTGSQTMDTVAEVARNKNLSEDVKMLRAWLDKQPHLPHDLDEELLTAFVHGTKSLEKAKMKLDAYLSYRGNDSILFSASSRNPTDPAFLKSCESLKMFYLPQATEEGNKVFFIAPHLDFSQFHHLLHNIRWMMLAELSMIIWPDMPGRVTIMDMSSMDSSLLKKITISSMATSVQWLQSTMPIKLKKLVYINAPNFVDKIYSMLKPFLKKKLIDRITITSKGVEVLKEILPIDILPKEYGGKEVSAEELNDYWMKMLVQKREWLAKAALQCSNESLRPPDVPNTYSVDGTFRYLQID